MRNHPEHWHGKITYAGIPAPRWRLVLAEPSDGVFMSQCPADDPALVERFARELFPVAFEREKYEREFGWMGEAFENAQAQALERAADLLRKLWDGI